MTSEDIRQAAIKASEEWTRALGVWGYETMSLAQAYRDGYKEAAGFEAAQDAEQKLAQIREECEYRIAFTDHYGALQCKRILAILNGENDE